MLNTLRERIGKGLMPWWPPRGQVTYGGFGNIKTVGILFNAENQDEFELVKKYVSYLRGFPKKSKAIGFFPSKEIPDMHYSRLEYEFFCNRDLDIFRRPKSNAVREFMEQPFDLLIDMNLTGSFPLYYVAAGSRSKLKIGCAGKHRDIYDLMIEMEPGKGLKYFLRNVDQYLEMLGPPDQRAKTEKHDII